MADHYFPPLLFCAILGGMQLKNIRIYFIFAYVCALPLLAEDELDVLAQSTAVRRPSRLSGGVRGEFNRALSLLALLSLSSELTQVFQEDRLQVFKALTIVAACTFLVDMSLLLVQGLSKHGPSWCGHLLQRCRAWAAQRMGLPPAFDPKQLLVWQRLFVTLVEQMCVPSHGALLSREQEMENSEQQWLYMQARTQRMLKFMIAYYEGHEQYYRAHRQKRAAKMALFAYVGNDADHVCFLIQLIVADMRHILQVITEAHAMFAIDQKQLYTVCQQTSQTMQQLYRIISGDERQTYNMMDQLFLYDMQ